MKMNRRSFFSLPLLSVAGVGPLPEAPLDVGDPQKTPQTFREFFQQIMQCVQQHPGAILLNMDSPQTLEIGWGVSWKEGSNEHWQSWYMKLREVKGLEDFKEFQPYLVTPQGRLSLAKFFQNSSDDGVLERLCLTS